jgi:hypothetical protein
METTEVISTYLLNDNLNYFWINFLPFWITIPL